MNEDSGTTDHEQIDVIADDAVIITRMVDMTHVSPDDLRAAAKGRKAAALGNAVDQIIALAESRQVAAFNAVTPVAAFNAVTPVAAFNSVTPVAAFNSSSPVGSDA